MSLRMKFFAIFALAALLAACAPGAATQTPPPPAPVIQKSPTPEPPTAIPDLTLDAIKNGEYSVTLFENAPTKFKLVNGIAQNGTDPAVQGYLSANMVPDKIIIGDLNGDGENEAVAVIGFNTGGTGVFEYLYAIANQSGIPVELAKYAIDDRGIINNISIENGVITLDAIVHGVQDPGCCPSFQVTRTYRLEGNPPQLVMTSQSSKTADGKDRIITIDSPEDGSSSGSPVHITGSVTIAPFENTLVYRIFDPATGKELKAGPVMVNAPDLGAPGTFETDIVLDIAPSGPQIRIEIQETSMADGSLLAMDSVTLTVP